MRSELPWASQPSSIGLQLAALLLDFGLLNGDQAHQAEQGVIIDQGEGKQDQAPPAGLEWICLSLLQYCSVHV